MSVGTGPLAVFGRIFGDDVTCGDETTKGWKGQEDVQERDGSGETYVVSRDVITVRTGALAGLVPDVTITFQGVTYKVREPRRVGDGSFTKFWVTEV